MPRPFRERIKDSTWWLEQAAHGWIGAGSSIISGSITYSVSGSAEWAFGVSVGLSAAAAIIREAAQNVGDEDNDVPDAVADSLFTWLGGILASIPWAVVPWV